jgi:hypothetical protein
MQTHVEIDPIKVWVAGKFLYGGEKKPAEKGRIIAVSSYVGHVPTFQILLDTGHLFSYVPPHMLCVHDPKNHDIDFDLNDCVFHNCPPGNIVVNVFKHLQRYPVQLFTADRKPLDSLADYLFSVDWIDANDVLHCVSMRDSGQIKLYPQHKIDWSGSNKPLPPYIRVREEYRISKWKP